MRKRKLPYVVEAVSLATAVFLTLAISTGVFANSSVQLVSGVGYGSESDGPSLLLGANWTAFERQGSFFSGLQETSIGLHLSDVFHVDSGRHVVTLGVETGWSRYQGPVALSMDGHVLFRYNAGDWARTAGVGGSGMFGGVRGSFRFDYVEGALATFPWLQKDLEGMGSGADDSPFYRAHIGVSASVWSRYNLRWSQDVRWHRPVDSDQATYTVTTGPEMHLGPGLLAFQGGIHFGEEGIRPMGQVRYQIPGQDKGLDFEVTAATLSLEGGGPVVYGWLGYDNESMRIGAALRLEEHDSGDLNPALYFSIQPKF